MRLDCGDVRRPSHCRSPAAGAAAGAFVRGVESMFFAGQPDAFHLQPPAASGRPVGGGLKRALDIAVASSAIILLLPLLAIVALLVLITNGRPVFSRRTHVGFGGRAIDCYRFRSMPASDAVASQASLATLVSMSGIDRLPELFNVLMGDLSWVGPRPLAIDRLHARKGDRPTASARAAGRHRDLGARRRCHKPRRGGGAR